MKVNRFFLWCAGSNTALLAKCSQSEKIKHIGFGTLVLVPAILAFVSMSFALSTIDTLADKPLLYYLGGLIWSLIIFSFDRFIVSTHRRKMHNREEFQSPSFFLRFTFALILGIVISHPLVILYFDGSVKDQIQKNIVQQKEIIHTKYDAQIAKLENQTLYLDSLTLAKEKARNEQELLVAKEIDGEVIKNAKGEIVTTGLYGKGPSAQNKIKHLEQLQKELEVLKNTHAPQKVDIHSEIKLLKAEQQEAINSYTVSYDYLKREVALEQLKEENPIVGLTQFLLILLFVLVDILPFIFKTFAPFGMYDRILYDEEILLKEIDNNSKKAQLQEQYQKVSSL